ncbi:MAG: PPK2 family polyphosphate kinase, partial [Verrucomicrobiales bacterium]
GGKDGCIKHVFSRIDPQGICVQSFKKPSEDEMAHDFLWRVHPHVPRNGELVIFNRSHYEDILAVRVKKLSGDEVWQRRYRHIIEFERMLAEEGTTIVKIFLNISKDEQKRRLESRLSNPSKYWKFNPDDLQDRARWGEFMGAYEDLISRTSTEQAPWYVIPADRKWYRNLCVANIMVETLRSLNLEFPKPTWDPATIKVGD